MNQYVIYRVKDTEIGKKLKHMPYNELGELVQEVKAENYEQIYFGLLEDNKKTYQLRKDLEKQIEPGKKLEVGDVLVINKEGLVTCSYVDSEELIRLSGFICFVDSDAAVKSDTTDYEISPYKGKWRTVDYIIFDGKQYFLMENQMYGAYTMPMLLNQYGQVIMKECNGSFDSESLEKIKTAVRAFGEEQKRKEKMNTERNDRFLMYQKFFVNGEYLRSAEMAEEQNYNMIDGRMNNLLPKKEAGNSKKKQSVLFRLYQHRCEVAKKLGKPMPRQYVGAEMELNRK
ncbi:hypothetical protein GCM10008922_20580 [Faecalicatena contorta]|uniref:DUF4316 domain-containing protein n=1 Tax=Faecalicatena contorta TaxID=39482 RepID=UPI0031CF9FA4